MTLRLLRAVDRSATPWKNGGGVTREVAAFPAGSTFDDFHWRVSMAEVGADGPFSVFRNVDRILAVLEGRLRLTIAGRAPMELAPGAPPAIFPGDAAAHAEVLEGPVLDLNLMSRRGSARASLTRVGAGQDIAGPAVVLALGPVRLAASGATYELGRYDALLVEPPEPPEPPLRLEGDHRGRVYVASFEDLSRS